MNDFKFRCFECGEIMDDIDLEWEYKGVKFISPGIICKKCGYKSIGSNQMEEWDSNYNKAKIVNMGVLGFDGEFID